MASYNSPSICIRNTISSLINAFLRNVGVVSWPNILQFLYNALDTRETVEMALETLIMIFEDSGELIEEKFKEVGLFL